MQGLNFICLKIKSKFESGYTDMTRFNLCDKLLCFFILGVIMTDIMTFCGGFISK